MRRFTRLALAALAAIGASGALVAAPAASWVNFADTTSDASVEGVRQYTLTSNGYTITVNGTPNNDGSVTLGRSSANTNNTGIVLTGLGALSGTKIVSVMLDIGDLPAATPATPTELLAINFVDHEVELKRVVADNGTSTIQQQWDNDNRSGDLGKATWTPTNRQILTLTYSGDSQPRGTATYLNGSPLITNVSGLMTTEANIARIGIGENSATEMKVYGIYLFTSKLTDAQVVSETAAAAKRTAAVSGAANWSGLTWAPSAPTSSDSAVLQVAEGENTLTLDNGEPISLLGLFTQGTGSLTFNGSGSMTSSFTSISSDTDVSAITANLGAVTLASNRTLTTKRASDFSSITAGAGSTVKYTAPSGSIAKVDNATVELAAAAETSGITLPSAGGTYKVSSGTYTGMTLTLSATATNYTFAGGELTFNGEFSFGTATATISGGTIRAPKMMTVQGGNNRSSTVTQTGGKIIIAGTNDGSSTSAPLIFGHWRNATSTYDLSGGSIEVAGGEGGIRLGHDSQVILNISGTGLLKAKGLWGQGTQTCALNLSGGKLSLGSEGFKSIANLTVTATGGEINAFASNTIAQAITVNDLTTFSADTGCTMTVSGALSGTGTVKKSGAGRLLLTGAVSTPVELAEGTLDLGIQRPAVTVTGEGTTLVLLQGLDDVADGVTPSSISLSFADGIESCTVVTRSFGGVTKELTISSSNVPDGRVNVTFPMETDTLPTAHRTCGFENTSLSGLDIAGYQNMTFTASPFPGQGNYGQITTNGRPYSPDNNNNEFRTETGARGFTFSLKVCPHTCANKGVLLSFGKSANAVALLWQDKDDTDSTQGRFAVYSVLSTGDANTPIVFSQWVTKDAWHAVSVVSSLETRRFYITVDGQMAKSEVLSNGLSITNGVFQVGSVHGNAPSGSGWTDGVGAQVDDFRFDKVPLAQTQIAQLLFHYAKVSSNSALTGLTEFGSGTQVAWANLKATADARISVADGVTATATLTARTAATLKVWGAGTLEVAKGESAQRIEAVELKEANTTLLLHRSQAEVVTSRVGTVGTFKFDGGTENDPLVVPYNVAFPGAIAVAADSCVKLECTTGSNNVSYQVSGAGQSSKVILTSDHPWGVLNTGSVTSLFSNLTLSIGGNNDFWIRAGLTDNVWLDIQNRTVTQEADAPGTNVGGVLTVRNLTGGGTFTTAETNKTLRLLNTDAAASEYSSGVTITNSYSNKLVFAGKWTVPNAITTAKYPATVEIGDGSKTDVQLQATGNARALTVAANATLEVATGVPGPIDDYTPKSFTNGTVITNNGTLKLTSGYAYLKVGGLGETVIPGSDFVFGVVDNPQDTFANALTVNEGATFRVRAWGEDTFAITTLTLNGEMTREGGDETVKATVSGPATLKTLGTNVNLTLNGTLTDSSNAFAIGNGSCLTLNLSEKTTIENCFSGSGNLVIGDGAKAVTVALTGLNGDYSGMITVAERSTLSNGSSTATVPFGKGSIVNNGALKLTGPAAEASKDYAQLPPVSGSGDITFCSSSATRIAGAITTTGTVTIEGKQNKSITNAVIELQAAVVVFGRNGADFKNTSASIEGPSIAIGASATLARSDKTEASSVTIANGKTLSGTGSVEGAGTIGVPITFVAGSVLDATSVVKLNLTGKVTGTVNVKVKTAKGVLSTKGDVLKRSQLAFAGDTESQALERAGYRFVESLIGSGESVIHDFKVMAKVDVSEISTVVNDNDDVLNIIYNAVANDSSISKVTNVTAMSADFVTKPTTSSSDALALFENLYALATPGNELTDENGIGTGTYEGTVTVYYDFGISQLHVKRAALDGEENAPLYVLLCAKVESVGMAPADYATGTIVTLYKGDTAVNTALTPDDEQLKGLGIEVSKGEKWFAVLMETLFPDDAPTGTQSLTVKARK